MENSDKLPSTPSGDDVLIFGQFDSEPTWLARQNLAADAIHACVQIAADIEQD